MSQDNQSRPGQADQATKAVELHRLSDSSTQPQKLIDAVVVERAVTVMVDQVGSFTLLCTPSEIEALAVGFVFSEGIIDDMADVIAMSANQGDEIAVGLTVVDPSGIATKRNLIISSSCGMCGARNIENLLSRQHPCETSLRVSRARLLELMDRLRSMQTVFQKTGAAHAAGVFDADGTITAMAEDIGRHNAMDKAIGKLLLADGSATRCGVVLSGRVSFDMVAKAARAGIEVIAAVSAPSSLAIEAAQRWNITLCGFVRSDRVNVYTHPERIKDVYQHIDRIEET